MKILITGATGFVGKNLITFLDKSGHTILPFRIRFGEKIVLPECDAIIHLAGKAHDLKKVSSPEEYYQVNKELTNNLYTAFLSSSASKFIFMSTVKAVADKLNAVLDESFSPDPKTHYGKSKLMAEQFIQDQPLNSNQSFYILRPCMIHGPGNKGNLNLLYKLVNKGIPYPLAAFDNRRSFLSIENLNFVIGEIISQHHIQSGIYHIADDDSLSTNEVITVLSASLNKNVRLWRVSPFLIRFFAGLGDKLHLPLNTERLDKLTENYVVSNQKICEAINKKLPVSAKDGLQKTAVSFQNTIE